VGTRGAVAVAAVAGLVLSLATAVGWWTDRGPAEVRRADGNVRAHRVAAPAGPPAEPSQARRDHRHVPQVRPPRRVSVPVVGMSAPVRPVGVTRDRQMALPGDPDVVGWYRFGPAPGAGVGSVVIAGHVDTREDGLGALSLLRGVRRGDRVVVTAVDGTRRAYRVFAVRAFDKQALPRSLFRRRGAEALRMVTCTGDYDADEGSYEENLVVTARPV
jgi:hypothetical protein